MKAVPFTCVTMNSYLSLWTLHTTSGNSEHAEGSGMFILAYQQQWSWMTIFFFRVIVVSHMSFGWPFRLKACHVREHSIFYIDL